MVFTMKKILFTILLLFSLSSYSQTWDKVAIRNYYGTPVLADTTGMYTNLATSSATVGWQSDRISNMTTLANDYEIFIKMQMKNTAAANDKALYVYVCPWYTTDGGSTWRASDQGTTTLPTGTRGSTTIASPNNLVLAKVLNYTTTRQIIQGSFLLSNTFGSRIPDGFSLILVNYTGAADSTQNEVYYTPLQ